MKTEIYYRNLSIMSRREREIFCFILNRTKSGLWTSYADCAEYGIKSPSKSMSELRKHDGIEIICRQANGRQNEYQI